MIKLVAIDLDGTLLNQNHTVSKLNKKAINMVREKEIKVVLCSGRTIHNLLGFAKELGINGVTDYVVGYNGAGAVLVQNEEFIYSECLSGIDAKFIAKICEEVDANFTVHTFTTSMTPRLNPYSIHESSLNGVELLLKHPRELHDDEMVTKVLILDDPEKISNYEDHIRKNLSENYHIVRSMPMYLEVMKKGISKFSGIMAVADRHQIKKEEIMALGDAQNDLEIIKEAGIGIAMGNAEESIRNQADFVTKTNNEDGVAYAMNYFLNLNLEQYLKGGELIE